MKRIFTLAMVLFLGSSVSHMYGQSGEDNNQPDVIVPGDEEENTNWTRIGIGYYHPGLFDYFTNEWPEALEAVFYEDADDPGRLKVEPEAYDFETPEGTDDPGYLPPICPFIVYAYDYNKVYCNIISSGHRYVFDAYHFVPEIVGIDGKTTNYGHLSEGNIWFDQPESFRIKWITGWVSTNLGGEFRLELPQGYLPGTGALTTVNVSDNMPSRYYNLQGVEVMNPTAGNIYIRVNGDSRTKVIF